MVNRRQFHVSATSALGGLASLQACSPGSSDASHERTALDTWRHGKVDASDSQLIQRELVRYATLAPSSHNAQCWKFRLSASAIEILPDLVVHFGRGPKLPASLRRPLQAVLV